MRFLLDESADARLGPYLVARGHEVIQVAKDYPAGLPDTEVLALAHRQQRILIANDRDFGELVFKHRQSHTGVILFRLGNYAPLVTKIARLDYVLTHYHRQLDQFLVVTPTNVRVGQLGGASP